MNFNHPGWASDTHNMFGFNSTNVYKVTSLDEAIMRSNTRQSETVYFNQSKNEFYNVRVDMNGNKSWQTFIYMIPNAEEQRYISKTDFDTLVARIEALERKGMEVVNNGQSNG